MSMLMMILCGIGIDRIVLETYGDRLFRIVVVFVQEETQIMRQTAISIVMVTVSVMHLLMVVMYVQAATLVMKQRVIENVMMNVLVLPL